MSQKALQDYTFISKYARYDEEKKRRENWQESVKRVEDMHREKYPMPEIQDDITWAFNQVRQKKVLGSQRALQFGGTPILKKNTRLYNCFSEETSFITEMGVKKFSDFKDGDNIRVLSHDGSWKKAVVHSYGKQKLNAISLKKGVSTPIVKYATSNHTWILKDETKTTELSEGDQLCRQPNIFNDWN